MSLSSLPRLLQIELKKCSFILSNIPKISLMPSANMTSKEWQDPNVKKPAPWPYKTRRFTYFHACWTSTIKRFDENTKIIVVDGNMTAGKANFAKELAESFGMMYVPETSQEPIYITANGYDLRQLNPIFPPSYKICDLDTFLLHPGHPNAGIMQMQWFWRKLTGYIDCLAHLLNTGQGIVMDKSVYGDFIFIEAMHKFGYFSKAARKLYYDIIDNTIPELMRPHLIIYLDVSPEVVLERIKKRNHFAEVNSPLLTKEYLEYIEQLYKYKYLKEFAKHSEILVYDWNNYGDMEVVVEDVERIDFDKFTKYDTQLSDWRKYDDWEWSVARRQYTNPFARDTLISGGRLLRPSVTELHHPGDEALEYKEIMRKVPGEEFVEGYNPSVGDNVWFKFLASKGYWHRYSVRER